MADAITIAVPPDLNTALMPSVPEEELPPQEIKIEENENRGPEIIVNNIEHESRGGSVIQVTNISPGATLQQMGILFGYLGQVADIKMYPTDEGMQVGSKVCYVKYAEPNCCGVAQHLTNTIFIDRALIVVPLQTDVIPDEARAMQIIAPANALAGRVPGSSAGLLPTPQMPQIPVVPGVVLPGITPGLVGLNAIGVQNVATAPPQLGANVDPNKVEEIRRTVYVGNLDSTISAEQLLAFFSGVGEIKYVRLAGEEGQPTRFAFIEFTDAGSVNTALQYNGVIFGGRPLKVNYSKNAIVKPESDRPENIKKEVDRAMKQVRELEKMIADEIEPVPVKEPKTRSRSRSRSKTRRSRSRSRSRGRRYRSRQSRSRSRSRSGSRRRRRTKSRSRSKERRRRRSGSRSPSPSPYSRPWYRGSRRSIKSGRRKSKSRSRSRSKSAEKPRSRSHSIDDYDKRSKSRKERRSPSRSPSRSSTSRKKHKKDKERDRDRDREKDKRRSKDREREKDRDRDRDRDKERDRDRDRERDKDRNKDKDKDKDRDRDRNKSRSSRSSKSGRSKSDQQSDEENGSTQDADDSVKVENADVDTDGSGEESRSRKRKGDTPEPAASSDQDVPTGGRQKEPRKAETGSDMSE